MRLTVYADGASRGNPGPASIGASVQSASGDELTSVSEAIGRTTNNVAEYRAAIAGVRAAHELGATSIDLRLDSELIVRQLAGSLPRQERGPAAAVRGAGRGPGGGGAVHGGARTTGEERPRRRARQRSARPVAGPAPAPRLGLATGEAPPYAGTRSAGRAVAAGRLRAVEESPDSAGKGAR